MTHTPGPWTVQSRPDNNTGDEGDDCWWYSFEASKNQHSYAEHEANARIMSASLEMLETLKAVIANEQSLMTQDDALPPRLMNRIRAAIALAKGEQ